MLEDLSARLPVDLSEAEQTLGCFTQNCIVVAEGELQANGVFKVGEGVVDCGPACSWMGVAMLPKHQAERLQCWRTGLFNWHSSTPLPRLH